MIIAEIGLNHLGSLSLLKKYILRLNKTDIDAITIQILDKNFFIKNNLTKYYLKEEKIYSTIFKFSKKKIGLIINNVDYNTKKYLKKISFFKILGDQLKDKKLLNSIIGLKKKIYLSNKNCNSKDKKKLNKLCKKNKNIFLIHTQGLKKFDPKFSNLFDIQKINKATNKKTSFGVHCTNFNIAFLSLLFKPKNLFFLYKR